MMWQDTPCVPCRHVTSHIHLLKKKEKFQLLIMLECFWRKKQLKRALIKLYLTGAVTFITAVSRLYRMVLVKVVLNFNANLFKHESF